MTDMTKDNGGPAFPHTHPESDGTCTWRGMSRRDYFAIHAPEATKDWLDAQHSYNRARNPHNDSYKPAIRSELELRVSWRWAYADAMLAARARHE